MRSLENRRLEDEIVEVIKLLVMAGSRYDHGSECDLDRMEGGGSQGVYRPRY